MIRDFTEETKERLLNQIDEVNGETWSAFTDGLGDIALTVGKWLGLLDLKDDMSNVESYQKAILDKTDMTKNELNQIFENVYAVDTDFKGAFSEINEKEELYNSKLDALIGLINPNFQIASAKEIMAAVSSYNEQLEAIDQKIAETYIAEMDWAAKQALKDAGKNFLKGLGTMASGLAKLASGNAFGFVDEINGFFQLASSLETALNLGGYAISGSIADLRGDSLSEKLSSKQFFLDEALESSDNEGLADVLDDMGMEGLSSAVEIIDTAVSIAECATNIDKFLSGKKIVENSKSYANTLSTSWKTIGTAAKYTAAIYDSVTGEGLESLYKTIAKDKISLYKQAQSLSDTIQDGVEVVVDTVESITDSVESWFN